ncbi:hypothetical protein M5K25_018733 [Dendrobium thyrsiflorum]|uniref:Uncharacterized protein n=1 Tax=Dendrobium thyrsiflorum TaxID=117978 RepID=A0ABD0UJ09_DENTH
MARFSFSFPSSISNGNKSLVGKTGKISDGDHSSSGVVGLDEKRDGPAEALQHEKTKKKNREKAEFYKFVMDETAESFNKFKFRSLRFKIYPCKLKTVDGGNEDEPDQDPMVPSSRAIMIPGLLSQRRNLAKSQILEKISATSRHPLPAKEGRGGALALLARLDRNKSTARSLRERIDPISGLQMEACRMRRTRLASVQESTAVDRSEEAEVASQAGSRRLAGLRNR